MALSELRETLAVKLEGTPGTAEALAEDDAQFTAYDITYSPNVQQLQREARRNSLGSIPGIVGQKRGSISYKTEMVGSGDHVATPPPWDSHIRACGFERKALKAISIGAISSGPFIVGQIVDNGSGATATVAKNTRDGASVLFVTDDTGTFANSDNLTVSGQSVAATAAGAAIAIGYAYVPRSSGFEYATVGNWQGDTNTDKSLFVSLSGCLGNFTLQASNAGEFVGMEFEFQGSLEDPVEADMVESTEPSEIPPIFVDANVTLHDGYDACINSVTLSPGNTVDTLSCANSPTGIKEAVITSREANGSIDPLGVLPTTGDDAHDFLGKWLSNATGEFEFSVGSDAGNRFIVQAPRTQYSEIDPTGARTARRTFQTNLQCHDTNTNDQIIILAI